MTSPQKSQSESDTSVRMFLSDPCFSGGPASSQHVDSSAALPRGIRRRETWHVSPPLPNSNLLLKSPKLVIIKVPRLFLTAIPKKYIRSAMETSFTNVVESHHVCSSLSMPNAEYSKTHSFSLPSTRPYHGKFRIQQSLRNRQMLWKEAKCAKGGSVSVPEMELETQFGDELMTEEELMGLGRSGGKCKEVRGIAELLECLEREAIMGEDEGKEPIDYNRRAQIFDKSSRVFQALKRD